MLVLHVKKPTQNSLLSEKLTTRENTENQESMNSEHSDFLNSEHSGQEAREITENRETGHTQCRLILNGAHSGFAKQWKFPKSLPAGEPPARPPRSHLTCFHIPHPTSPPFVLSES